MRTKALVCAAALAAGAVTSMAQSNVYSLNVVGYVNTTFASSFTCIANPLNAADNHLGQILKGPQVPDNTIAFIFDTATQDFVSPPPTYVASSQTWVPDAIIQPGQGVFVFNQGAPFTNTFVGDVMQGSITNVIAPNFNVIASPVPLAGDLATVLSGLAANDNDLVFKFNTAPAVQDFGNPSTFVLSSHTWVPAPGDPAMNIGVGEGMLYFSTSGANNTWIRNFTVQ